MLLLTRTKIPNATKQETKLSSAKNTSKMFYIYIFIMGVEGVFVLWLNELTRVWDGTREVERERDHLAADTRLRAPNKV